MNKVKDLPKKIYLQLGEGKPLENSFNHYHQVTWCKDKIFKSDVEYVLSEELKKELMNFLFYLYQEKEYITDHDFEFEKVIKQYCKHEKK